MVEKYHGTDAVDGIDTGRDFSLTKRCYGIRLIRARLDVTIMGSIVLSIIVMNIGGLVAFFFHKLIKLFFKIRNR